MINLDFLKEVEVFRDLDDSQLTAVKGCCQEEEYREGEKIFGINEDPLYLYAVIKGEVELILDIADNSSDRITAIGEKMIFGWSSLVSPYEYRLSAYAISKTCSVLKIDTKKLKELMDDDHRLGFLIMSKIVSVVGSRFYGLREEVIKIKGHDLINQW